MSDNSKHDQVSAAIKRALDILFVANPKGTSIGIFAGVSIHGFVQLFQSKIDSMLQINIDAIRMYHYLAFGIFSFNLPQVLNRNKVDPRIEEALKYIKDQVKAGTVNEWQARQMYVELHSKVLSSIVLNEKAEAGRRKLKETLSKGFDVE